LTYSQLSKRLPNVDGSALEPPTDVFRCSTRLELFTVVKVCSGVRAPGCIAKAPLVKLLRCQQLQQRSAKLQLRIGNVLHSLFTGSFAAVNGMLKFQPAEFGREAALPLAIQMGNWRLGDDKASGD
jgi:hypothetical protein